MRSERLLGGDTRRGSRRVSQAAAALFPLPLGRKQAVKRIQGVKYLVAPYEADAQLGFLARNGHVDAVITEDSDVLLFGCTRVLFKLDRDGMCQEVDLREMFHRRYGVPGCTDVASGGNVKAVHSPTRVQLS